MTTANQYSLVISTTDSSDEAESLAERLVENRLAACVQLANIVSHFVWEGKATKSDEILILIKTRADKVAPLREFIEQHHSYDTPELIELPIVSGLPAYLSWIDEVVT